MKENSKLAVELHRQHMLYCLPLFYLGLYLHDEQKRKYRLTMLTPGFKMDLTFGILILKKKKLLHRLESILAWSGFKIHFRFGFTVSTLLLRMRRSTIITTSALKIDLKFGFPVSKSI